MTRCSMVIAREMLMHVRGGQATMAQGRLGCQIGAEVGSMGPKRECSRHQSLLLRSTFLLPNRVSKSGSRLELWLILSKHGREGAKVQS